MKTAAKWFAIIWSIFCLIGLISGMANVGKVMDTAKGEYEEAGATIGMGCGFGLWAAIWLAIAGPAFVIYSVSGKGESPQAEMVKQPLKTKLCKECGKYFEGSPNFCPHCGKLITYTHCKECGNSYEGNPNFCPCCGKKIQKN